jgi:hypothetical protein
LVTVISLANVAVGAICVKGFINYSMWKKSLFGVTIFLCSHASGMYNMRAEVSEYNKAIIDKYQDFFLRANLEKKSEK